MNDKELSSLLKYSSPRELYIVTWNNLLKVLFCPFKVTVLNKVGQLKKRQIVLVEEVKITNDLKTVYIIKGVAYYYYHFDILTE